MPTARSRPISRVRSNTDNASVMAMPKNGITIAMPSRPMMTTSSWLIWPSWSLAELGVGLQLGLRELVERSLDLGRGGVGVDAVGELGEHELIARRQIADLPRASRSRCTSWAAQRVVVEDAGDGERRARRRSENVTSTGVADCRRRDRRPCPCTPSPVVVGDARRSRPRSRRGRRARGTRPGRSAREPLVVAVDRSAAPSGTATPPQHVEQRAMLSLDLRPAAPWNDSSVTM